MSYIDEGGLQSIVELGNFGSHLYLSLASRLDEFVHQEYLNPRTIALPSATLCLCPPESALAFC